MTPAQHYYQYEKKIYLLFLRVLNCEGVRRRRYRNLGRIGWLAGVLGIRLDSVGARCARYVLAMRRDTCQESWEVADRDYEDISSVHFNRFRSYRCSCSCSCIASFEWGESPLRISLVYRGVVIQIWEQQVQDKTRQDGIITGAVAEAGADVYMQVV